MKKSKLAATLLLSALLFAGCGVKDKNVVMRINDREITQKEFDGLMNAQIDASPFGQMQGVKENKDGFMYLMIEQNVVNNLIIKELLDQEAQARGIKVSGKDVDEYIKKIMDKMGGKENLMDALNANGISVSEFKKDAKNQVKMHKLAESSGITEVTDQECKDFYNKNLSKFKHGEQVRASHILISAIPDQIKEELTSDPKKELSEDEVKAKVDEEMNARKELAQKISNELTADISKFAAYAKKYSQDPGSAKRGGDLGFFDKDKMVPEFSKAVFGAKPNSAPGVVKTQYGYHVFIVTDRMEAGTAPYEKVQSNIKDRLTTEKEIKALDDIVTAAKKKANIEYLQDYVNPEVIEKKLHGQVNELTNGAKDRADAQAKKAPAKK